MEVMVITQYIIMEMEGNVLMVHVTMDAQVDIQRLIATSGTESNGGPTDNSGNNYR